MDYKSKVALAEKIRNRPFKFEVPSEQKESINAVAIEKKSIETRHGVTDFWLLQADRKKDILVLNIHGGGFCKPHNEGDLAFCASVAKHTEATILDIDYKLAPEHPFPVAYQECYDLILWAIENQKKLGITAERIIIIGHSSGGNIGTAVVFDALKRQDFVVDELILDYPPLDLYTDPEQKEGADLSHVPVEVAKAYNSLYADDKSSAYVSPVFAGNEMMSNFPDTTLLLAGKDVLKFEGINFARKLIDNGVLVTVKLFENAHHGFTITYEGDEWRKSQKIIIEKILGNAVVGFDHL